MITLYDYWRSSASYRVRIGLGLLGLDWKAVSVNLLTGEHKGEAHITRNPQGLVPTLEIDGLTLTQSLAMLEYLNETREAGWLPDNAAERARVRALSYVIAMDIHPVCNTSVARFAVESSGGNLATEDWMQHFIGRGLAAFERLLTEPGAYCHGDTPGLADICLVPQLYNAERWGVDMSSLSRTCEIGARLNEIPAFAATHPDQWMPQEAP